MRQFVVSTIGAFLAMNSFAATTSVPAQVHCSSPASETSAARTLTLEPGAENTYRLVVNTNGESSVLASKLQCRFTARDHRMFYCQNPEGSVRTVRVEEEGMTSLKVSPFSHKVTLRVETSLSSGSQTMEFAAEQCEAR